MIPGIVAGRLTAQEPGGGGGGYVAETLTWESRIGALGGSVTTGEKDLANALIVAIQAASYGAKILYLLPFIGNGVAAHRVPLRDSMDVGAADSTGFVDADCTTATGIANPTEVNKWFNTKVKPQDVYTSRLGLGWWERAIGFGSNVEPMGCYDSVIGGSGRCCIDLRTNAERFSYGHVPWSVNSGLSASSSHYYGQMTSDPNTEIFKDGALLASNTLSSGFNSSNSRTIHVMGLQDHTGTVYPWKGRGAVAYITDGSLSDADVAAFHSLLNTYLVVPTGR
jgi:hypothetical protein